MSTSDNFPCLNVTFPVVAPHTVNFAKKKKRKHVLTVACFKLLAELLNSNIDCLLILYRRKTNGDQTQTFHTIRKCQFAQIPHDWSRLHVLANVTEWHVFSAVQPVWIGQLDSACLSVSKVKHVAVAMHLTTNRSNFAAVVLSTQHAQRMR